MTNEHYQALLTIAGAKADPEGWSTTAEERWLTLHVSHDGVGLTVTRVVGLRLEGQLVFAKTSKGDQFVLSLGDVFAVSAEAPKEQTRQAGFR